MEGKYRETLTKVTSEGWKHHGDVSFFIIVYPFIFASANGRL